VEEGKREILASSLRLEKVEMEKSSGTGKDENL
jgi:hypothetical protein